MDDTIQKIYNTYYDKFSRLIKTKNIVDETYDYFFYITYKHIYLMLEQFDSKIDLQSFNEQLTEIEERVYTTVEDYKQMKYKPESKNDFKNYFNDIYNNLKTLATLDTIDKLKLIFDKYELMCKTIEFISYPYHTMYNAIKDDYYELKIQSKYHIKPIEVQLNDTEFYLVSNIENESKKTLIDKKQAYDALNSPPIENNNVHLKMSENMPLIRIDTQTIASNILTSISIQLPNDLRNYIFITENTYEKCKNIPKRLIPLYIKINESVYNFVSVLGCGSSGIVLEYTNGIKKYSLKIVENDTDDDIIMGKLLLTKPECKNYIINYCILQNNNLLIHEYYILMDYYDNTLIKIKEYNIPIKNQIKLIIQIIEACICFKRNNLYYTDLKAANILFTQQDNTIICVFADIGSFANPGGVSTYPQPGKHNSGNISTDNCETNICWSIFVLFLYFYTLEIIINNHYYYNNTLTLEWHSRVLGMMTDQKLKNFFIAEMQYGKTFTFDEILKSFNALYITY